MRIISVFFTIFILLTACREDENMESALLPSCMQERATVAFVENRQGVLQDEAGLLLIMVTGSHEILEPCNLPARYSTNDKVLFSGNKKKILPNERRAGQPFELTFIERTGTAEKNQKKAGR